MAESQTEADCVQLCCLVASPPQPILICTEASLRADSVFASECWLATPGVFLFMHVRELSVLHFHAA